MTRSQRMRPNATSQHFQLEKTGVTRFDLDDPYHLAMTLSWPQFLASLVALYLLINLFFALLFWAAPGSVANLPPDSLVDSFFFSVETLATVGYGTMSPATRYGHVVATVEIFVGMMLTATMTGLVFVRFSKPKAKLVFAEQAVISRRQDGGASLKIRIGNGRMHALSDAIARVSTLVSTITPEGDRMRRVVDLSLDRSDFPYFPLTWTLVHEIDEASPLAAIAQAGASAAELMDLRLLISVTARDPLLGAQVYATHAYGGQDLAFGMRYADAVTWDGASRSVADMGKISAVEPDGIATPNR